MNPEITPPMTCLEWMQAWLPLITNSPSMLVDTTLTWEEQDQACAQIAQLLEDAPLVMARERGMQQSFPEQVSSSINVISKFHEWKNLPNPDQA